MSPPYCTKAEDNSSLPNQPKTEGYSR